MKIFAVEYDNGETGEDRIVGVGSNAFASYLDASNSLIEEGYLPTPAGLSTEDKSELDIEFYLEDDEEVARILELNLVESV